MIGSGASVKHSGSNAEADVLSISVVIPVYNNSNGLKRTLSALIRDIEPANNTVVVVVDDGSTDETSATAEAAARDHSAVMTVRTPNGGPSAARNVGAASTEAAIIVFLDANDEPRSGWLNALRDPIRAGAGISHCDPTGAQGPLATEGNHILPGCYAIHREVFDAIGGFDEELRFAENSDVVERSHRWCQENNVPIAHDRRTLLTVHDVTNPRRYDTERWKAMEHLLERDADLLDGDRARKARLAGIGAVCAVRVGQPSAARRLAFVALRSEPKRFRHWVRLSLMLNSSVARRRWPDSSASLPNQSGTS